MQVTLGLDSHTPMLDVFQQICEEYSDNFNFVYYDCWQVNVTYVGFPLGETLNNKLQV